MKPFKAVWSQGQTSRQAHRDLPDGTFERELGREGFDGAATHMYHRRPPTSWTSFTGPLRPRAFDLDGTAPVASPLDATQVLHNDNVVVGYWRSSQAMPMLYRDADGDLLLFVHEGSGDFYCDYGHLRYETGDYLIVPRGTMWRTEPSVSSALLIVEATAQSFQVPERGLLGQHAIYDEARLDTPNLDDAFANQDAERDWNVVVKRLDRLSTISFNYNPLDAIGWTGNLSVLRLNVRDLLPVTSHRYHLPPSVHATFEAERLLISTFVPRPFETDRSAIKVPFFHSNDDTDEVLFYHSGEFFSRDGIGAGTMSFHPAGFTHGPQPKALTRMFDQPNAATNEVAVMLDAKDPLVVGPRTSTASMQGDSAENSYEQNGAASSTIESLELRDYADSWRP